MCNLTPTTTFRVEHIVFHRMSPDRLMHVLGLHGDGLASVAIATGGSTETATWRYRTDDLSDHATALGVELDGVTGTASALAGMPPMPYFLAVGEGHPSPGRTEAYLITTRGDLTRGTQVTPD